MGTKAIDPQAIRNVTIIGDPDETARVAHRFDTIHWMTGRVEHTIRLAELSSHAAIADLERSIRLADGVIAVVNAAAHNTHRFETVLRVADDHQVARLCLVTGLDHPAADFDRCVRTIAETRGAAPLILHLPLGTGTAFEGVIDLIPTHSLGSIAAEMYGSHWEVAEQRYRALVETVMPQDTATPILDPQEFPPDQLRHRIRDLTRIGDVVPVLCGATPSSDDLPPLLDAIAHYLPSPMDVCQPEHALDY